MTQIFAKLLCLTLLFLSPGLQAASRTSTPFVGRWYWDGPETCAANFDGDNAAMQIKSPEIVFYENNCKIRNVKRLGNGSFGDHTYRFSLLCAGEGSAERTTFIFSLVGKSRLSEEVLVRLEPASGFTQIYRRCP